MWLPLRGGEGGGESKHSSVFLQDAARRKNSSAPGGPGSARWPKRTPQEILRGAARREDAAATAQEAGGAAAPRMTVAELRDQVRALGASEVSVRACTERRDLVELLASLQGSAAADGRQGGGSGNARGFQIPKMAADIAEHVTRWQRLEAADSDQASDQAASTAVPLKEAPGLEAEGRDVDAKIGKLKQLHASLNGAARPQGEDTRCPRHVRRRATTAPPHAGSHSRMQPPPPVPSPAAGETEGVGARWGAGSWAKGAGGHEATAEAGRAAGGTGEVVEEEEEDWGPVLEVREGRSSDECDSGAGLRRCEGAGARLGLLCPW